MSNLITAPFTAIYAKEIKDLMLEDMAFTSLWFNSKAYLDGNTVNIPQYNNTVGVMRDYVKQSGGNYGFGDQGDTRVSTGNLEFTLKSTQGLPQKCTDLEDSIVNFDLKGAIIRNHAKRVIDFKGKELLFDASVNIASGRTVTASGALKADGTSAITYADFVALAELASDDNVTEELYAIVPRKMYSDILNSADLTAANEIGVGQPRVDGVVSRVAGINIIVRNTALQLSATTAGGFTGPIVQDPFVDEAAQSNQGALIFSKEAIAFAIVDVKTFVNVGMAQNYGDEFSSEVYGSAIAGRSDGKGVYMLANG
jgi:hypothetical protein